MARSRSKAKTEDDMRETSVGLPIVQHGALDPRIPMDIGMVITDAPPKQSTSADARDLSSKYARNLIANNGDVPKAIMATLGLTDEQYVVENIKQLHERCRSASRSNTSAGDMFERHDLTTEVRLAKLREGLFSPDPRVSLKSIEMLNEMDATAQSKRFGTSWESLVERARENAGKRLAKAPR